MAAGGDRLVTGELARRLDIAESSAAQMCQGKRKIPNRAAVWLETLGMRSDWRSACCSQESGDPLVQT